MKQAHYWAFQAIWQEARLHRATYTMRETFLQICPKKHHFPPQNTIGYYADKLFQITRVLCSQRALSQVFPKINSKYGVNAAQIGRFCPSINSTEFHAQEFRRAEVGLQALYPYEIIPENEIITPAAVFLVPSKSAQPLLVRLDIISAKIATIMT